MDVAFYLGTLAIHWYGILIALAVIDVGIILLTLRFANPMQKLQEFSVKKVFA